MAPTRKTSIVIEAETSLESGIYTLQPGWLTNKHAKLFGLFELIQMNKQLMDYVSKQTN